MAWSSLASNQIPTFTDLQTSGFSLNAGQSAVTSNECVTKSQALTKYNLSSTAMSAFASNQLVPKSAYASGGVTSYSYTVKLGTTTSNVCSATPITIYSDSSTWSVYMLLYEDAALTINLVGYDYAVLDGTTDIYNVFWADGSYLDTNTGLDCVTAYAYSVQLSTTIGGVCTASPSVVYSSSATWTVGMTLYTTSALTTLKTGFSYVLNDITTDIYNLNSTTAVVGSDTGSNC